uniref:Uncharacterized protein n=1 Tax=Vibrio sp. FF_482 TaxID=1652836 RepID=A0A0H3ZWJ0_9VIBR|nr:hypothetical protein [Vibrio sp. FF_482]
MITVKSLHGERLSHKKRKIRSVHTIHRQYGRRKNFNIPTESLLKQN